MFYEDLQPKKSGKIKPKYFEDDEGRRITYQEINYNDDASRRGTYTRRQTLDYFDPPYPPDVNRASINDSQPPSLQTTLERDTTRPAPVPGKRGRASDASVHPSSLASSLQRGTVRPTGKWAGSVDEEGASSRNLCGNPTLEALRRAHADDLPPPSLSNTLQRAAGHPSEPIAPAAESKADTVEDYPKKLYRASSSEEASVD